MAKHLLVSVKNVEAVGMHHWGPKELVLNASYLLYAEKDNTEDCNAVSVHELAASRTKRAYLSREWAKIVQPLLPYSQMAILKVREPAIVLIYDKGPQHNCIAHLKCSDAQVTDVKNVLAYNNVAYTVKEYNE
jgi:hypothetical protein